MDTHFQKSALMQPRLDRPKCLRVDPKGPARITRSFTRNTRNKQLRVIPTRARTLAPLTASASGRVSALSVMA